MKCKKCKSSDAVVKDLSAKNVSLTFETAQLAKNIRRLEEELYENKRQNRLREEGLSLVGRNIIQLSDSLRQVGIW